MNYAPVRNLRGTQRILRRRTQHWQAQAARVSRCVEISQTKSLGFGTRPSFASSARPNSTDTRSSCPATSKRCSRECMYVLPPPFSLLPCRATGRACSSKSSTTGWRGGLRTTRRRCEGCCARDRRRFETMTTLRVTLYFRPVLSVWNLLRDYCQGDMVFVNAGRCGRRLARPHERGVINDRRPAPSVTLGYSRHNHKTAPCFDKVMSHQYKHAPTISPPGDDSMSQLASLYDDHAVSMT